ncbi:MAG: hypothetical protein ACREKL_09275 [Chthoniobacterales bacterium]
MTRLLPLAAVVFLSFVMSSFAGEAKVPSLVGTWTATSTVSFVKGTAESSMTLVVTAQSGANFHGYMTWSRFGKDPASAKEGFAGVVDFDGKTIVIAQDTGGGLMRGTLSGKNAMKVLFAQAAQPKSQTTLAFRAILTRKK